MVLGLGLFPGGLLYPSPILFPSSPGGGRFRLVNPRRLDRRRPRGNIYVNIPTELTVLAFGSTLRIVEAPSADEISAATYAWLGGRLNITDDPAVRALWLANNLEVEPV